MLPPKSPGHSPGHAASPAGATATRPSIGRSGTSMRLLAEPGMSSTPSIRARSICQTNRRPGSGSFSILVRPSPATPLIPFGVTFDTAISRFGVSFRIRTTSVSPGAAPSMRKGPTSPGHGPATFGS
jgi:hypothetical protein